MTKQNLGRGCFYYGERTHIRRDCLGLKQEGSKVSSPKRAGLAVVRVAETRDTAPEGSAGETDTRCDVRAGVQDGLLQLASGKQVPTMVDCGAIGGKKSMEDLNLPVVKGLVGDKTVNALRDTSCEGVVYLLAASNSLESLLVGKQSHLRFGINTLTVAWYSSTILYQDGLEGHIQKLLICYATEYWGNSVSCMQGPYYWPRF